MKRAGLALLVVVLGASSAAAQPPLEAPSSPEPRRTPLTGRAVVFLELDEGVDEFVSVFVYEVIAGRLRDLGFVAMRESREGVTTDPLECLSREACAQELMLSRLAPLVLAFHLSMRGRRLVLTWRRSDEVAAEPRREVGNEGAVAAAIVQALMELEPGGVPCVMTLESSLPVRVAIEGASAALPTLVPPGSHLVSVTVAQRAPWAGRVECVGGRVLRLRAD